MPVFSSVSYTHLDVYKRQAILRAEREGLLHILRYAQTGEPFRAWVRQTMLKEYENAAEHPDYRHFIEGKFGIFG